MAGLVAAARLRELGRPVVVREKGSRAGGSMLLSSCVVWRHREVGGVSRRVSRNGDELLQRLVWERLHDAIAWLVARGAPVVWDGDRQSADDRRSDSIHAALSMHSRRTTVLGCRWSRRRAADPLHGWVRRVTGARHAVHRAGGASCACARTPGRPATALTLGARTRRARLPEAWTSSTDATCPRRPRARRKLVSLPQL